MDDAILAGDDRTLRLAAPEVTAEKLDRFIAFAKAMALVPAGATSAQVAKAHADALAGSGLAAGEVGALEALCRDFVGRRAVVNKLRLRLQSAQGELKAAIEKELSARTGDQSFERRYGAQALKLLADREQALLALHPDWKRAAPPG